jgi:hypothetical protein
LISARQEFFMPMPRRILPTCLLALAAFLALVAGPRAQALGPKGDAFVGYSRTGSDIFYPSTGALNGWEGALHIHLKPLLGIEGDVAHYGLGKDSIVPRTTTYLAGPRITVGALGIRLFAHGLVGGEHSSNGDGISGNAFAYAFGGGVDLPLAPFFRWRFMIDRLSAPDQSPSDGTHARFSTGLVFHF